MVLDRRQAADDPDQEVRVGHRKLGAQRTILGLQGVEREIEPERHHEHALGRRDPEPVDDVLTLLRGEHDHGIAGVAPEAPLDPADGGLLGKAEVAGQDVTVEGVDDARPSGAGAHIRPPQRRREAPDQAGLGGVGMDDLGSEARDLPCDRQEGAPVRSERDLTAERGDLDQVEPRIAGDRAQVVLAPLDASRDQPRPVAPRRQPLDEPDHLPRRSSGVESGDAVEHRWCGGTVSRDGHPAAAFVPAMYRPPGPPPPTPSA